MVAVVLARGGSRRIPKKNSRDFLGHPIIARTVGHLRKANTFAKIFVSSDSPDIEAIAVNSGAETIGLRPAYLSRGEVGTNEVMGFVADQLATLGYAESTQVCCVYATSVMVTSQSFVSSGSFSLLYPHAVTMAYTRLVGSRLRPYEEREGQLRLVSQDSALVGTQDLGRLAVDAGQFYWGSLEVWRRQPVSGDADLMGFLLPPWESIDIDEYEDWALAELVFAGRESLKNRATF